MNIVSEYGNITAKDRYMMTAKSVDKKGFKNLIDTEIDMQCAVITTDEVISKNDDGTESVREKTILSIQCKDGMIIAGDSKTTRDSFMELYTAFGDDLFTTSDYRVRIHAQKSKADRTFITLQLV